MLTFPTPWTFSRERMTRSASLYSSSGARAPETEMMRMGWALTSNLAITGRVASRGRVSAMPSRAFWTSITAVFMSVDMVNWRTV